MTDAIISGLLLGLALIFSVGPVIFTIIKLRINYGLASAFYFIAGVWLSDVFWVVTANAFSGFFDSLITHKKPIGIAGGILLIGLGIFYLFFKKYHTKEELDQGVKIGNATHARLFITGYLINTLNPGVIALWFAAATKSLS
ncbi:MAG: LysE family transporter, partial [Bacteroidetes bacterium]|nr:LysE family transporter [Bacteroidota bacterium]